MDWKPSQTNLSCATFNFITAKIFTIFWSVVSKSITKLLTNSILFFRERARKASRDLKREQNDTSGGGRVSRILHVSYWPFTRHSFFQDCMFGVFTYTRIEIWYQEIFVFQTQSKNLARHLCIWSICNKVFDLFNRKFQKKFSTPQSIIHWQNMHS